MATFTVTCPCCDGRLTIDPALEAVIAHEAPPRAKSGLGLDDALHSLKGAAARRAGRVQEELKAPGKKPHGPDKMVQERSEEHTSELQSHLNLGYRLLL